MNSMETSELLRGGTHETIESVADLESHAERTLSTHQRWIERTTFAGGRAWSTSR